MQVYNEFPLSQVLWYKVGGKAKHFIPVLNREDMLRALDFVEQHHPEEIFVCGLGSNLIFSDEYFNGVVIQIASPTPHPSPLPQGARGHLFTPSPLKGEGRGEGEKSIIIKKDGLIDVFSGVILDHLIRESLAHNLTGLEWAGGLPGTVGAGVRGNVGAFGGEIKDNFVSAEVLEIQKKSFSLSRITKANFNFSYRNSVIKEQRKLLVVSSVFQLTTGNAHQLQQANEIYHKHIAYRKAHHPVEYPNCGSVFKNIHNTEQVEKICTVWPEVRELVEHKWHGKASMGYLINRLGFSGYRVGGMEVSTKHPNFIINLGQGKSSDVLTIITHIQEKVSDNFGFIPEVEVEIVR